MTKAKPDEPKLDKTAIGLVGFPGSGKSAIARFLAEILGTAVIVMGDVVRAEAEKRNIPTSPEIMRQLMINLRKEQGKDIIARKCLQKIAELVSAPTKPVIIDGLRSVEELEVFRERLRSFHLVAVLASPQIRFSRLQKRDRQDDPTARATFEARDTLEVQVGVLSLIDQADYSIINEQDLEILKHKVRELAEWIKKKEAAIFG
ncbi:MAG: AAA family ATPase [Candidatus Heimdallarchaeota archaeon]